MGSRAPSTFLALLASCAFTTSAHALIPSCGFVVAGELGRQDRYATVSDRVGGAYVSWADARHGSTCFYLTRLGADGRPSPGWPESGLEVEHATSSLGQPSIACDTDGAVIVVWAEDVEVYAKRFLPTGVPAPMWPDSGVAVGDYAAANDQYHQSIPRDARVVAGTDGNAIIAWDVDRHTHYQICEGGCRDVYYGASGAEIVELDGVGKRKWETRGYGQTSGSFFFEPVYTTIASDDSGGLLLLEFTHLLQWVNVTQLLPQGDLSPGWPVDLHDYAQYAGSVEGTVIPNGSGGAFAVWTEAHGGVTSTVFVAQVDGGGLVLPGWGLGKRIASVSRGWASPQLAPRASGGAIVSWTDLAASGSRAYLLALDASGDVATGWPPDGLSLGEGPGDYGPPSLVSDGADGAFVVWQVTDSGVSTLKATHVLGDGTFSHGFESGGTPICSGFAFGVPMVARLDVMHVLAIWNQGEPPDGTDADIHGAILSDDIAVATLIESVRVTRVGNGLTIEWLLSNRHASSLLVERALSIIGPWSSAGSIAVMGGRLEYEDRDASPASRCYRLREPGQSSPLAGSTIEVPGVSPGLSIKGPLGAPLRFQVEVPEPARLELFDVAGRRLRSMRVEQAGIVDLDRASKLAPGVYVIRLSDGVQSVSARACVVR